MSQIPVAGEGVATPNQLSVDAKAGSRRNGIIAVAALLIILICLPFVLSDYVVGIVPKVFIFALFGVSLHVLWRTGLVSLGQAAYFGVGAYATAILEVRYGVQSFWLSLIVAVVAALLLSALLGLLALRMSGWFFILVTLALGQLVYSAIFKWTTFTGGTNGLAGIGTPNLGFFHVGSTRQFYFLVLVVVSVCIWLLYRLYNSSLGHAFQGIHSGELRMGNLGYAVWRYKYTAFLISGGFAGVAGTLYAHYNGIVVPASAGAEMSTIPLVLVCLGGDSLFIGPIVGAVLYVIIEYFASLYMPREWQGVLGLLFLAVVLAGRGGVTPQLVRLGRRLRRR